MAALVAHDAAPLAAVRSAADIAASMSFLKTAEQEHVYALGLDVRHRIVLVTLAALGTVDSVRVSLRDVFREAVRANLPAVALVHNHPSGDFTPSLQDIQLTTRMRDAAQLLGIEFVDHVIIAAAGFYSFVDHGHLTPRKAS
jgi:DNA repair protein RadC